jgi:hypothetical protein
MTKDQKVGASVLGAFFLILFIVIAVGIGFWPTFGAFAVTGALTITIVIATDLWTGAITIGDLKEKSKQYIEKCWDRIEEEELK